VWWIDVVVLTLIISAWMVVPPWMTLTAALYRRRGADLGEGDLVAVVFRAALILIAVFATVDFVRRLA
jgi:hypothetical protein